ncbi:uncharacterized protein LOC105704314 [Orussus abietinus]|uniref:uncharacterized protein LOC105704314 n=1 Tax=Orussus abietinus TaxID=222816 RepID=UPI000625E878|nr:uncharacterized protein LOC105704314 [Orussus abietinus]XP_012288829.1 uncharacterized protein LOC105704314 [Orussus abietinus]
MKYICAGLVIAIVAACTCGARGDCTSRTQISFLTSLHDDPTCRRLSPKGVLLAEASQFLIEAHNNRTSGNKIEVAVLDTCNSITGAVKATMKALVLADMNCLQPPQHLGFIGPDSASNVEAVQKVTSVLKVPHIVKKSSDSPYMHRLVKESDSYIVQGTLKVIEALKWKSFTLVAYPDEDGEDDIQNIARKLTNGAILKNLCVMVHDDESDDFTSHVVHIGQPEPGFLSKPANATILVVSEGNVEELLNGMNTTNTVLLLEDARDDLDGLESRVLNSKLWSNDQATYDAEELRDVRWLEDAILVYTKSLETVCKKKKCRNPLNPVEWNNVVEGATSKQNTDSTTGSRTLELFMKGSSPTVEELGKIVVNKGAAKIYWRGQEVGSDEDDDDSEEESDAIPKTLKKVLAKGKDVRSGCATSGKEIKTLTEDDEQEAAHIVVSEMDDSEWWTMVGTVSGVGVAMFAVGILAVYILYSNIRGPRSPKGKTRTLERDTSLRRVGSDRELPSTITRNTRPQRGPQRRDSNRSIRSNISDKSV